MNRTGRLVVAILCCVGVAGCSGEDPGKNKTGSGTSQENESPRKGTERVDSWTDPEKANPLIATVGPLEFYLNDLLKLTRENELEGISEGSERETIERFRKIRKETLSRMIDRRLLILESARHPEWVSDASWEEEVQALYSKMGTQEIERRRKAANLGKEEFDERFRKFVREEMMIRALIAREVESVTPPTEEDLRKRYEEDLESVFTRPDSWSVYHIERYLDREHEERLPDLLEEMENIRSEVADAIRSATTNREKAKRMEPLVRKYSQAEDAQTGYAYIYDTPEVSFDPEFVDRVRSATLGELSPVFELAGDEKRVGACFFLVFDHRPGEVVRFENARRIVEQTLLEEARKQNRDRLFERLEKTFPVKVFEEKIYEGLDLPDTSVP